MERNDLWLNVKGNFVYSLLDKYGLYRKKEGELGPFFIK